MRRLAVLMRGKCSSGWRATVACGIRRDQAWAHRTFGGATHCVGPPGPLRRSDPSGRPPIRGRLEAHHHREWYRLFVCARGPCDQRGVISAPARPGCRSRRSGPDLAARRRGESDPDGGLGLIVAGLLVIGSVPFFVGLAVVLPVLGHATWHLYRKVIEPDLSPRPEQPGPTRRQRRYAAQFPTALFGGENQP
jgi:hypothetical protein